MEDREYLVSRTLELKIAIAENKNQNTMLVTLDVLKEIFALLKVQEALVRCTDCKYFREDGYCTYNNIVILKKGYYCADGRRDEDESSDCL